MTERLLKVIIHEIHVENNGDSVDQKGRTDPHKNNTVIATLKYPRSGAPTVVSKFPCDLTSGQSKMFDVADFWDSGLLKETVQEESKLELIITDRDAPTKIERFFHAYFTAGMVAGMGVYTGMISSKVIGAIAGVPVTEYKDALKLETEYFKTIASIHAIPIHAATALPEGPQRLDLFVPESYTFFRLRHGSPKPEREEITVKKGCSNGYIVLSMRWV
ncbi:hypothetical protein JXA80_08580 [bacterium]|nr:hypothetical protein [candidate division CSSED10-310 bacterium]